MAKRRIWPAWAYCIVGVVLGYMAAAVVVVAIDVMVASGGSARDVGEADVPWRGAVLLVGLVVGGFVGAGLNKRRAAKAAGAAPGPPAQPR